MSASEEVRVPVRPIQVQLACSACGTSMRSSGRARGVYPTQREYECPLCWHREWKTRVYPYIEWEEVK